MACLLYTSCLRIERVVLAAMLPNADLAYARGVEPVSYTHLLTGVEPPIPPTAAYGGRGATVNLARGQPVRAYRCTICGYIELYDAHDVEPQTWGP